MKDICKNCGGWKGLHHSETGQCPLGGVERFPNAWTFTTYEPTDTSHEAAQRLAQAGNDLSIAFALVPVDWNCEWAGETASKAVEADKKFRAALAEWEAAK